MEFKVTQNDSFGNDSVIVNPPNKAITYGYVILVATTAAFGTFGNILVIGKLVVFCIRLRSFPFSVFKTFIHHWVYYTRSIQTFSFDVVIDSKLNTSYTHKLVYFCKTNLITNRSFKTNQTN